MHFLKLPKIYLSSYILRQIFLSFPKSHWCVRFCRKPCRLVSGSTGWRSEEDDRHLRSARRGQLDVPRVRLSTYGGRAFCHVGPSAWNTFRVCLKNKNNALSLSNFRHQLKHFYFSSY